MLALRDKALAVLEGKANIGVVIREEASPARDSSCETTEIATGRISLAGVAFAGRIRIKNPA